VLLPPGVTVCSSGEGSFDSLGCSGVNYCAYHDHANVTFKEGAHGLEDVEGGEVFAVIPYVVGVRGCDSGQHPNGISDGALSGGMAHEFAEMTTNPAGNGRTAPQIAEYQEVADMCEGVPWAGGNEAFREKMMYGTPLGTAPDGALYNQVVDGREYYHQQLWSRQRRALPPIVTKLSGARGSVAGGKKPSRGSDEPPTLRGSTGRQLAYRTCVAWARRHTRPSTEQRRRVSVGCLRLATGRAVAGATP
jgi:hypothetical protein